MPSNLDAAVTRVAGRGIPIPGNDIDTDRIIPARFLKEITFQEMGKHAFEDERFDADGKPREHPMNDPRFQGASILLVNENFGCGSSREHAPQALMRWGIHAILGESFAEIFAGNCTALGIPTARMGRGEVERLMEMVQARPDTELVVDLEAGAVTAGGERLAFELAPAQRQVLLSGTWDTAATLLAGREEIARTAERIPYIRDFPYPQGAA